MRAARHRRTTPRGWLGPGALILGLICGTFTTAALLDAPTDHFTSVPSTLPVGPAALTPAVVPAPAAAAAVPAAVRPVRLEIPRIAVRAPLVKLRVRRGVLQPPSDPRAPAGTHAAPHRVTWERRSSRATSTRNEAGRSSTGSARCAPATG